MATEKRLIDVNKVIDEMQKCIDESAYARDSIASYTFGAIIECLKREPTVDAVEVIRCKNCKHYDKKALWCNINSAQFSETHYNWYEEDFCSYGERRTNE